MKTLRLSALPALFVTMCLPLLSADGPFRVSLPSLSDHLLELQDKAGGASRDLAYKNKIKADDLTVCPLFYILIPDEKQLFVGFGRISHADHNRS
jgi:hypothetical protein